MQNFTKKRIFLNRKFITIYRLKKKKFFKKKVVIFNQKKVFFFINIKNNVHSFLKLKSIFFFFDFLKTNSLPFFKKLKYIKNERLDRNHYNGSSSYWRISDNFFYVYFWSL